MFFGGNGQKKIIKKNEFYFLKARIMPCKNFQIIWVQKNICQY